VTDIGTELHAHVVELFPICRSITGEGLRRTLRYVAEHIPLQLTEVATGTKVLDWEVPREWTVRAATLETIDGQRLLDFAENNLHVVQYSAPFDGIVGRRDLDTHLHSLPERADSIPYVTSYYQETWGLCLSERQRASLCDERYYVRIDTELAPGSLTYGESVFPGVDEDGEVLISTHCCHPSMANDNLASIAVAIGLAKRLANRRRRFTWRFLFAPGTIGAICWLDANRNCARRIRHGLVLTCLGDPAQPTYKQSRQGNAAIDRIVTHVLRARGAGDRIMPFVPTGYDERQYCSPGFNLPIGCLMRSPGGSFPEYHTSDDNIDFVDPRALADSLELVSEIADIIEQDRAFLSTAPYGEPQLGKRGLYNIADRLAILWTLNLSDGQHTLLDIAERSGRPFAAIFHAAEALQRAGLLTPVA
jgi:aminopeptidase-like protein